MGSWTRQVEAGRPALRHVGDCRCAECEAIRYGCRVALECDQWRQHAGGLDERIKKLERQLAEERYARLTAEIHLAIARNDRAAWAKAIAERETCDVPAFKRAEIEERYIASTEGGVMLTADTITDEQIRELRWHALFDTELPDSYRVDLCDEALGKQSRYKPVDTALAPDASMVRRARARCAEILNARGAK